MNKPPFDPSQPFSPIPDASSAPSSKPPFDPTKPFEPVDDGVDFGGVVKDALNEAFMGNGSKMRALMTDPVTQAKALPYLAGTAGAMAPIPGGATLGTVGGRQLSNAALRAYGHPEEIPSTTQQVLEGGAAALGDLTAFPAINRMRFGAQVGEAERAAGVAQLPESLPRPSGPAGTTEWIDSAKKMMDSGQEVDPEKLKQIGDQIDFIYKNRKDVPLSNADSAKLAQVGGWAQNKLNTLIPERAAPAADLARSQIIPNTIGTFVRKAPWWAKAAVLTGATGAGVDNLGHMFSQIGSGR